MPEFLELQPPDLALREMLERLEPSLDIEPVQTSHALGRVTAEPVLAPYPLPSFTRSTVDGYAVRARDTYGAGESQPAYLHCQYEIPMGARPPFPLEPGACALIHTGGMLPEGADSVVMVENTQSAHQAEIEILRAAAPGENVLVTGEDVAEGEQVIEAGFRLRPAEIGGLSALGIVELKVFRRPLVGLISSGDEVVSPESELQPGQVRDVNSFSLSALVEQAGGVPQRYGIAPDNFDALREVTRKALAETELVVITAGSSASARDLTSQVIDSLGDPGVLVHGVNVRPGKPTILAICAGKPVIGLPGNPVSALLIARLFIVPLLELFQGRKPVLPGPRWSARLSRNVASQAGREDWVPVRLTQAAEGLQAEPIFGKSNLIFTLVRASGLVRIPAAANGLSAGEMVQVYEL